MVTFGEADLGEVLTLAAPSGWMMPAHLRAMVRSVMLSEVIGVRADGRLVAAAGVARWKVDDGEHCEVWFVVRPDIGAALRPALKAARLTVRRLLHDGVVEVFALVRAGHRPGQRLAHAIGLSRLAETWNGYERWST